MELEHSYNDWRDYLAHERKSQWTDDAGNNTPAYNHKYYEEHKEEILAKRKQARGTDGDGLTTEEAEKKYIRDFGGKGVGNKAKDSDDDEWGDDLSDDVKKNIEAHNKQVDENIKELTKSVEDYIKANKDKLSDEQIKKLKDDLKTQTEIANEQKISYKNKDDKKYVDDLLKGGSTNKEIKKVSSKSSSKSSSTKSSSSNKSSSTSSSNSTKPSTKSDSSKDSGKKTPIDEVAEKYSPSAKNHDDEAMSEAERRAKEEEAKRAKHSFSDNDWRTYLVHRR